MKKALALVLALALSAAAFAGCGSTSKAASSSEAAPAAPSATESAPAASSDTQKTGGRKFAYCTSTLNNPFMKTIGDTFQQLCMKNGDDLIIMDPQYDQSKQLSQIEDAITQGVDGIFLIPVDSNGVKSALDKAKAKGVPVIAIDNPVTDIELVAANISSDNYNAGLLCGQTMAADFPDGAKIAVIDSPTMQACVERVNGFMDGLGDLKDKFTICAQQDGTASLEKSMPIAENMIQANPDIKAFFCINDPSALGTIAALKANNKLEGIKIYAVDGSPDAKAVLKTGELTLTVAQSPVNLAITTYNECLKVLAGETIEKDIKVETFKIDATNVDEYGIDGWQ
ncbi:sugar ABC transporter substrate-binding protein [Oscillospiraceae bacterium PP1C4]